MKQVSGTGPKSFVLGRPPLLENLSTEISNLAYISCAELRAFSVEDFGLRAPDYVISTLFCNEMDCVEIGAILNRLKYQGTYLILADELPDPKIITREIKQLYPKLTFRVLTDNSMDEMLNT